MAAHKGNNYPLKRKVNPQHTKEQIQKIIDNLYKWAYDSDGVFLTSFTWEYYKKTDNWLYQLADHHPEIKDAIVGAKALLSSKIGRHSWIGDRNSSFGEKILYMHSKEFKDSQDSKIILQAEAAQKAKQAAEATQPVNIYINDILQSKEAKPNADQNASNGNRSKASKAKTS